MFTQNLINYFCVIKHAISQLIRQFVQNYSANIAENCIRWNKI